MRGYQFIATQKLYNVVDSSAYRQAISVSMQTMDDHYTTLSSEEKWHKLMDWFDQNCPGFSHFRAARLNVVPAKSTMSLETCIDYFEQFYFLCTTTDPNYVLMPFERTNVLVIICKGASPKELCEPGRQEQFDNAIQLYCRDCNWVQKELSRYRYGHLYLMHERCNRVLGIDIDDTRTPHTLKLMKKLAVDKQLGVKIEGDIEDIFRNERRDEIVDYFEKNWQQEFSVYEDSAVNNLTDYLCLKFTDFLKQKQPGFTSWDNALSPLSHDDYVAITLFWKDLLRMDDFCTSFLCDIDAQGSTLLKQKSEFIAAIRNLVTKKLCHEGYIVPYSELTKAYEKGIANNLRIAPDTEVSEFATVIQTIQGSVQHNPEQLSVTLSTHASLLIRHPGIFLHHLETHPHLLTVIPEQFKESPAFMTSTMKALDCLLIKALDVDDHARIKQLTDDLLQLISPRLDHLLSLSEKTLRHHVVVMKMLTTEHVKQWYILNVHKNRQPGFASLAHASQHLTSILMAVGSLMFIQLQWASSFATACLSAWFSIRLLSNIIFYILELLKHAEYMNVSMLPENVYFLLTLVLYCKVHEIASTRDSAIVEGFNVHMNSLSTRYTMQQQTLVEPCRELLQRCNATLFPPENIAINAHLKTRCEHSIERLMLLDDQSENLKGQLLEILWEKIQQDDPSELHLKSYLDKTYEVEFQGKIRKLSFSGVESTQWISNDNDTPARTPWLRFFTALRNTSTEEIFPVYTRRE